LLIPAVTMSTIAQEKKSGTLELLLSHPITKKHLILGKFFGSFILIILALIPTLLYVYTIWTLASPQGAIDLGSISGSYFGLCFLMKLYGYWHLHLLLYRESNYRFHLGYAYLFCMLLWVSRIFSFKRTKFFGILELKIPL